MEVVAKSTGQLEDFTGGAEPDPGGVLGAAAPLPRVGRLKELVARVSEICPALKNRWSRLL